MTNILLKISIHNQNKSSGELLKWSVSGNVLMLGSLSNDDGDVNENGKKAIGLDKQNNNFARASRFFVHFFVVTARLRREMPNFTFCGKREDKTTPLFFFPEPRYSLIEFNSQKIPNIWQSERDGISAIKFEAARLHFFFRSHRCRCCLRSLL